MELVGIKKVAGGKESICYINPEKIIQIDIMNCKGGEKFFLYLENNIVLMITEESYATLMSTIIGGNTETWIQ